MLISSGKSLRKDHLKELICDMLGIDEFDEHVFIDRIDHISVRDTAHLTFHLTDGTTAEREYTYSKEVVPHTQEQKDHMSRMIKEKFTPELRQQRSEKMKQIRSEKFWSNKRK